MLIANNMQTYSSQGHTNHTSSKRETHCTMVERERANERVRERTREQTIIVDGMKLKVMHEFSINFSISKATQYFQSLERATFIVGSIIFDDGSKIGLCLYFSSLITNISHK